MWTHTPTHTRTRTRTRAPSQADRDGSGGAAGGAIKHTAVDRQQQDELARMRKVEAETASNSEPATPKRVGRHAGPRRKHIPRPKKTSATPPRGGCAMFLRPAGYFRLVFSLHRLSLDVHSGTPLPPPRRPTLTLPARTRPCKRHTKRAEGMHGVNPNKGANRDVDSAVGTREEVQMDPVAVAYFREWVPGTSFSRVYFPLLQWYRCRVSSSAGWWATLQVTDCYSVAKSLMIRSCYDVIPLKDNRSS